MRKATLAGVVLLWSLFAPIQREAAACAKCASSGGVVGCTYKFFYYWKDCAAFWTGTGFSCSDGGACDEVGPPDPTDPPPKGPFFPEARLWRDIKPEIELPDGAFALLPVVGSKRALTPL